LNNLATNTQNLFEKYGIKEVADVTFYRIEKKEETYEAQRTISIASVLRGAVEVRTVYPFKNGISTDEGFDAYVFTDAEILTGANYDCDDQTTGTPMQYSGTLYITATPTEADPTVFEFTDENIKKAKAFGLNLAKPILAEQYGIDPNSYVWNVELDALPTPTEAKQYPVTGRVVQSGETDTGIYTGGTAVTPSISDTRKYPGTHEYSYAE
jgi:hypothetical protein